MNNLDDLLYLAWKNGQFINTEFPFLIRMQASENRFWKRMLGSGSKEEKPVQKKKGAVIPEVPEVFTKVRLKRLEEHGIR